PIPPGPKVVRMPTQDAWVKYRDWGKEYGELVYLSDRNTLIINKSEVAIDLLEKRARIYSDRIMTPIMKLCGLETIFGLLNYSEKWRRARRNFQQLFRQAAISRFYPVQYSKTNELLRKLLVAPDDFMNHTMALSQGPVYSAIYGLEVRSEDPLAQKAVQVMFAIGQAILSGAFPVLEQFPFLRYMPSWFPGCGIQQFANQCRKGIEEIDTIPFNIAVNNLKSGTGTSPIAELVAKKPTQIEAVKAMGIASYVGETCCFSVVVFLIYMLSICLHPDIQIKGQEEIDRVIGKDRLPTFEDRPSMPYIEAIYHEVMRLDPAIPLDNAYGLPHASTEDDFYYGYYIPEGCTVIPNIWLVAMNRDPDVYAEPDKFMPSHFIDSTNTINDIYAYGFGRRVCAGRYMADNTIWLTIASVLATFTLGKAKDEKGNEIDIPGEYTNQFLRHPKPYRSSITPRNQRAKDLILATVAQ
ncbi:cytochrome P450 1, partial [Lentinula aciculospora]